MPFPRLRPGDAVGVVAPAGVVDATRLARGVAGVEAMGFRPHVGDNVLQRVRYCAGDDAARVADLQHALNGPTVRAVMAARGGYGCQRILPSVDLAPLVRGPKPVVGYSDVTAVLNAVVQAGVVAIHGPMVAADFSRGLQPASLEHFRKLLCDPTYEWSLPVPTPLRSGRAEGRLLGGCLSVLVTTLGTPFAPDTDGAILFLEDTHEWPYRLDRMITHARQAGLFERVAGVVLGTFETCRTYDDVTPLDVLRDLFADAPFPVAFGLAAGHASADTDVEQLALPLGVRVAFDADAGALRALEPAAAERT